MTLASTMSSDFSSLLNRYNLGEEDCNRKVTDVHIEKISRSFCRKWRSLPSHLELDDIVVCDVERDSASEKDKRNKFFTEWKEAKGSDATYTKLITALLVIYRLQE